MLAEAFIGRGLGSDKWKYALLKMEEYGFKVDSTAVTDVDNRIAESRYIQIYNVFDHRHFVEYLNKIDFDNVPFYLRMTGIPERLEV